MSEAVPSIMAQSWLWGRQIAVKKKSLNDLGFKIYCKNVFFVCVLILTIVSQLLKLMEWFAIHKNENLENGASFFYEMKNLLNLNLKTKIIFKKNQLIKWVVKKKTDPHQTLDNAINTKVSFFF